VTIAAGNTEVGELRATRSGAISDSARICLQPRLSDCPKQPGGLIGGSSRDDEIEGSKGPDAIVAGPGDDKIRVRGGLADEVDCGGGRDTVKADGGDQIAKNCEKVRD
jgi:Ca2+-binding RTX toxin-like protein